MWMLYPVIWGLGKGLEAFLMWAKVKSMKFLAYLNSFPSPFPFPLLTYLNFLNIIRWFKNFSNAENVKDTTSCVVIRRNVMRGANSPLPFPSPSSPAHPSGKPRFYKMGTKLDTTKKKEKMRAKMKIFAVV